MKTTLQHCLTPEAAKARMRIERYNTWNDNDTINTVSLALLVDGKTVYCDSDVFNFRNGKSKKNDASSDSWSANILFCLLNQKEDDAICAAMPSQADVNASVNNIPDDVKVLICNAFDQTEAIKKDIDQIFADVNKKYHYGIKHYYDQHCNLIVRPAVLTSNPKHQSNDIKDIFDAHCERAIHFKIKDKGLHLSHFPGKHPSEHLYQFV